MTKKWWAELNLLLVAVFWGVNMPVMKFALGRVDEYLFNAARLSLSGLVLLICVLVQRGALIDRSADAKPLGQQLGVIMVFALLTGFAYQVLFLLAIDSTSAGNTALIMSTIPMWSAILATILLKERLSKFAWLGLVIGLAGTIVVTLSKGQIGGSQNTLRGNLLVSLAALSWAIATVLSRPMMRKISPVSLACFSILISLPFHFLIARHALHDFHTIFSDTKLFFAICYSGVFSTGLAYAMWNYGVKQLGAGHAAAFQNIVPLVALLTSWLLIGEIPVVIQILGGTLIIGGLAVMRIRRSNSL